MLAGVDFPARPQTLQHFLNLALEPEPDKTRLIEAIELDAALLLSALTLDGDAKRLSRWHESVSVPLLQAMAISLAGNALMRPSDRDDVWEMSVRQGFLAGEFAAKLCEDRIDECRLTGLVARSAGWFRQRKGSEPLDNLVGFLDGVGCSRAVCDAVRFQEESVEQLQGASMLLRIVSMAGRLVPFIDNSDGIPENLISATSTVLGLTGETTREIVGLASWRYEQMIRKLGEPPMLAGGRTAEDCFAKTVLDAGTGAVFYRALMKASADMSFEWLVGQTARFLLGSTGVVHFRESDDLLEGMLEGETVAVSLQRGDGAIAGSAVERRVRVCEEPDAGLVERQVMHHLASRTLLCVPLGPGAGVLACAITDVYVEKLPRQHVLMQAFAEAAGDRYRTSDSTAGTSIDLGYVQRRVREITHEVNNPLAIVQNYLRTMSLKLGDDLTVQKEIDAISRELVRVSSLLGKYRQIGSEEAMPRENVQINRLIEDLVRIVAAGSDRLSVETRFDESIPKMELAADALRQVILNVLKNAVEAMEDTESPRLVIATQGAVNVGGRHCLEITISDNGPGMSQEQRLGLFNHDGGSGRSSTKGEGRGLGLGIARRLLDEMSGMISCRESNLEAGAGTSFQILIPFGE